MVELSIVGYSASAKAFKDALAQLGESLKKNAAQAPRRAAIMVCKSLQSGTRQAKKNKGMSVRESDAAPKWITYKDGRKLEHPLRRFEVNLRERGLNFSRYVYSDEDPKQQLRMFVGTNYFPIGGKGHPQRKGGARGLAKRSWGWVMHNIYNGAAPDTPWERRKRDRRNPKDAARESMSQVRSGEGMARICNRLAYITEALKISPTQAMAKAATRIVGTINARKLKKSGMSSEDIREEASRMTHEFKQQFGI